MEDTEEIFLARPSGENVLSEYLVPLRKIVIRSDIMGTSKVSQALTILSTKKDPKKTNSKAVEEAISFAFKTRGGYVSVPEMDYNGNITRDMELLLAATGWEVNYINTALQILTELKDSRTGTLLGLLGRANRECAARRRMAFTTLTLTAVDALNATTKVVKENENIQEAHRERVKAHCTTFIDDLKERAFQSVFLQPTMMYFDSVYDSTASGDVDVHGSNTYLTILQATTGIHIPRLPFIYDDLKGIANVAGAGITGTLEMLHLPEHVGKSYQSVLRSRNIPRPTRRVSNGQFIFSTDGGQPIDVAFVAVDDSRANKSNREFYATHYLTPYAHYFSEEVILPWLVNACIQDETVAASLQAVFEEMKGREEVTNEIKLKTGLAISDFEDVKEWVWDIESIPPVFRVSAARLVLASCGVCKPLGIELDCEDSTYLEAMKPVELATTNVSMNPKGSVSSIAKSADELGVRIPPQSIRLTAAGDVGGGGTGREFLSNLHNDSKESWDKWLDPTGRGRGTSWVRATLATPQMITGYAVCSANDCPERDPMVWELKGLNTSTGVWEVLHRVNGHDAAEEWSRHQVGFEASHRWEWKYYRILEEKPLMSEIRLEILEFRSPYADCVQLGHFHLYTENTNGEEASARGSFFDSVVGIFSGGAGKKRK